MRALTIHGPWAWAIAEGIKVYENRNWPIHYRGPIAIHSGKSLRSDSVANNRFDRLGIQRPDEYPRSGIIAIANLTDCVDYNYASDEMFKSPFATGKYVWVLGDVVKLETMMPMRGHAGIFHVPELDNWTPPTEWQAKEWQTKTIKDKSSKTN